VQVRPRLRPCIWSMYTQLTHDASGLTGDKTTIVERLSRSPRHLQRKDSLRSNPTLPKRSHDIVAC
jgi:hypothetical protein